MFSWHMLMWNSDMQYCLHALCVRALGTNVCHYVMYTLSVCENRYCVLYPVLWYLDERLYKVHIMCTHIHTITRWCFYSYPPSSPVGSASSSPSSQGSPRRKQRASLTPTGSPRVPAKSQTLPQNSSLVGETGKGVSLFHRRAQVADQSAVEFESKQRVRSMLLKQKESSISEDDRVVLAETLREVEQEKLLAHEERWANLMIVTHCGESK